MLIFNRRVITKIEYCLLDIFFLLSIHMVLHKRKSLTPYLFYILIYYVLFFILCYRDIIAYLELQLVC